MSSRVRTVSNCANPCPVSFILRAMTCRAFQVLFTVTNCYSIESTSCVKQFVCCLFFRLQVFSSFSLPVSKLQFKSARNEWVPVQRLTEVTLTGDQERNGPTKAKSKTMLATVGKNNSVQESESGLGLHGRAFPSMQKALGSIPSTRM